MKKIFCMLLMLVLCTGLSACGCDHQWQAANCEHPKTCALCGETEGEPLSHSWQEADCEHPKTCSICGMTTGEALGHSEGEWQQRKRDVVKAELHYERKCSRCGKQLDTKIEALQSFLENDAVHMSTDEFTERMNMKLGELLNKYPGTSVTIKTFVSDGQFFYYIVKDEHSLCHILLQNENGEAAPQDADCFKVVQLYVDDINSIVGPVAISAMIETIDPIVSEKDLLTISDRISENINKPVPIMHHGIGYALGSTVFFAIIPQPGSPYHISQ